MLGYIRKSSGEGSTGKGCPSSAGAPKVPILIWQSCDVELWAEVGKGHSAHCVPTTLLSLLCLDPQTPNISTEWLHEPLC